MRHLHGMRGASRSRILTNYELIIYRVIDAEKHTRRDIQRHHAKQWTKQKRNKQTKPTTHPLGLEDVQGTVRAKDEPPLCPSLVVQAEVQIAAQHILIACRFHLEWKDGVDPWRGVSNVWDGINSWKI